MFFDFSSIRGEASKSAEIDKSYQNIIEGTERLKKNVYALQNECQELEQLRNLSIIHFLQYREDCNEIFRMYQRIIVFTQQVENNPDYLVEQYQKKKKKILMKSNFGSWNAINEKVSEKIDLKLLFSIKLKNPVCSVDISQSDKYLCFTDGIVFYIICIEDFSILKQVNISDKESENNFVKCVKFSPNEELIGLTFDNVIKIIKKDNDDDKIIDLCNGHKCNVNSLLFCNDSNYLFSCGEDGIICKWNLKEMKLEQSFSTCENINKNDGNINIVSMFFSNEKDFIYAVYMNGNIGKFNVSDLSQALFTILTNNTNLILKGKSIPNSNVFATVSNDNKMRTWRIEQNSGIKQLNTFESHGDYVLSLDFSNDNRLAFTGSKDQTIKIWSIDNGELITTINLKSNSIFDISHSKIGNKFVTCSGDGYILAWEY